MEKKNIYEIKEEIGRGSFGDTFRVLNKEDNKNYAMKKIFIKGANQNNLEKLKMNQKFYHQLIVNIL